MLADGCPGGALQRRIECAADAFHAMKSSGAPLVLCSGGRRWHGHMEAVCMHRQLVRLGVPPEQIVLETLSHSTAENALFSARLLRALGLERVMVVSCGWHLRRAVRDFARCGCRVQPLASPHAPMSPLQRRWRMLVERTNDAFDQVRLTPGVGL